MEEMNRMGLFKKVCLGKHRKHEWSEAQFERDAVYDETPHAIGYCHRYHYSCVRCGEKGGEWQDYDGKPIVKWVPKVKKSTKSGGGTDGGCSG